MIRSVVLSSALMGGALCLAGPALVACADAATQAPTRDAAPVLVTAQEWQTLASRGKSAPAFAKEQAETTRTLEAMIKRGIDVPVPKDPGGGYTHEQHKRNYQAIEAAGILYRLTGEQRYADYARELLLRYADLYPKLGPHPAGRGEVPGRLFWQTLNDSVWVVHAVAGYDAIRDTLTPADRQRIDDNVFRAMARFMSDQSPDNFNKIHNHATWAVAAVGMTGYVLRDPALVEKALKGTRLDGSAGFLKQIDQLFSPDGYYEEGPYYQRYALAPFILFADAIERNEPQRHIFQYRDGVLLKAVDALVQSSYGGYFFPINDAILDKGLDTEELVAGIDIVYAQTADPRLLSIAREQKRVMLGPEGFAVAQAIGCRKVQTLRLQTYAAARRRRRQAGRTGDPAHERRRRPGPGDEEYPAGHGPRPLRQARLGLLRQRAAGSHRLRRGTLPQCRSQARRHLPAGEQQLGQADHRPQHAGGERGQPLRWRLETG